LGYNDWADIRDEKDNGQNDDDIFHRRLLLEKYVFKKDKKHFTIKKLFGKYDIINECKN